MTNMDSIRTMTPEEFSEWLRNFYTRMPWCSPDFCPDHNDCDICIIDWLKREKENQK